jgi:hypothetical protein
MRRTLAALGLIAAPGLLAAPALAHHSDAPHYLVDETVELAGVVAEWRLINPHALLTLSVEGAEGVEAWECETNGPAFVRRAGLAPEDLKVGDRVSVTAAPGRNDPRLCLMRAITLDDGRVVRFQGGAAAPSPPAVAANSSIYGVWAATGGGPPRPTGALAQGEVRAIANRDPLLDHLTDEGRAATAAYDPYRDDPARRCSPVNPRRLWNAVGTPLEIRREGEAIVIRYEFMDGVRTVHLDETSHPADGERSVLGHSIGRFEGDTLVIDTANFAPGVIQQYVLDAGGALSGVVHSDAFTFAERVRFVPETSELEVSFSYADPLYYAADAPYPELTRRYRTSSEPVAPFDCVPDELE